jgi:hypothetical protein
MLDNLTRALIIAGVVCVVLAFLVGWWLAT